MSRPPDLRANDESRANRLVVGGRVADDAPVAFEQLGPYEALELARTSARSGDTATAVAALRRVSASTTEFRAWTAGAKLLDRLPSDCLSVNAAFGVAVLGSYTTLQFTPLLRLAGLQVGLALDMYEGPFGQFEQEVLDPGSELYHRDIDYVVLAIHDGAIPFPMLSDDSGSSVLDAELERWTALWSTIMERSSARVVLHLPALPPDEPLGHLASRVPFSRRALLGALNARLGAAAGNDVLVVDCQRLSSEVGSRRWFDPRFWHLSKQAVALNALPVLARHTAAVIAADAGLAKRCIVVDLDNTLWGGVVGEDGLEGIRIGGDAEGEAYQRFQEYLKDLTRRGIVVAVCSKNEEADARLPFERHPEMRLRLEDIACFVADWEPKPANVQRVAKELDLGLESLLFVDDNPLEREAIRRSLPAVDVVELPQDPALFVQTLSDYPLLEPARLTMEDRARTTQYRARAAAKREQAAAPDLDSFLRGLEMSASVLPFDELRLPRIVQLVSKTNQFNATTRRHGAHELGVMMADDRWVARSLELQDRFGDHGLVAVAIAEQRGDVLDIDTFLMSCRVMGRTVETKLLEHIGLEARRRSCRRLRGTFIQSERNRPAADLYERHDFTLVREDEGVSVWEYDLENGQDFVSDFIRDA